MEYASKGVGNTALGLSIGALGAELLGGTLGNILGGSGARMSNSCCETQMPVTRYESAQQAKIAELETEIKLRDSNIYTDNKLLEMYKYFDGELKGVNQQLCAQAVVNAQITANISCMQGQIGTLMGLTKTIIPIGNICPEPAVATTTTGA